MVNQNPISRELALRIGLASREAGVEISPLLDGLLNYLGVPLMETTLFNITAKRLQEIPILSTMSNRKLKKMAACFRGGSIEGMKKPPVTLYNDGDMPHSIRIAMACNDYGQIDGHFGSCLYFLVFQVGLHETRLIDIRETERPSDSDFEDKNSYRAHLVDDCQILYLISIGGPAAAKVIKAGIYPIKLKMPQEVDIVLSDLQEIMRESPPPWLAKKMDYPPEKRIRFALHSDE